MAKLKVSRRRLPTADADILTAELAAELLFCSPDTLRRIPYSELPVYDGPGRTNLYIREDLPAYLKRHRRKLVPRGPIVANRYRNGKLSDDST